jgi:hypothetical protein
MSSNAKD